MNHKQSLFPSCVFRISLNTGRVFFFQSRYRPDLGPFSFRHLTSSCVTPIGCRLDGNKKQAKKSGGLCQHFSSKDHPSDHDFDGVFNFEVRMQAMELGLTNRTYFRDVITNQHTAIAVLFCFQTSFAVQPERKKKLCCFNSFSYEKPIARQFFFSREMKFRIYINFYYMEESVLLGTKPLVDSIRHFIRDPSGVFSVCHLCECRIVQ